MRITASHALLLLCLVAAAPPASGGEPAATRDWPQWRGPNRDGISHERGLLESWPPNGPPLLWKTDGAGTGYSTVSVAHGRLFTMGNRNADGKEAEYVLAFDAATGEPLWSVRHGEPYHNNKGDGPRGIPTVDGDSVYALGANGDLACLATDSGTPRWHVNVLEKFGGRNIRWGLSESPLVDGNNVIVNPGGPGASIVALNKETGELVWKTDDLDDPAGYSSAIAADVDGMRQILHFTSRAAVGVSARDGKLLWRYEPVANKTADIATPIYHDQRVFYSSAYQTGCALLKLTADRSTGDANAEEVYFNRDMMNHHASCVLVDGHLYGFSNAILSCMEFDTGNVKWKDRSVGKGSLIYADGKLVCFSERGVVGLVDATPEAYREKGQFKIETGTQPTWSHPVIAAGRLYLRDQDALYCYDVRGKP